MSIDTAGSLPWIVTGGGPVRFTNSHTKLQAFYFDAEGLLRRHDYTADIVGPWAWGAHYSHDYQSLDGIPVATRREVFLRFGQAVTSVPVLNAKVEPVAAEWFPA